MKKSNIATLLASLLLMPLGLELWTEYRFAKVRKTL